MSFTPKGFIKLSDAIERAGQEHFSEKWEAENNGMWVHVFKKIQSDLHGTPTLHEDAVPSYVKSRRGKTYQIPPELWGDDLHVTTIIRTGRVRFHPGAYGWHWSPTAEHLEGPVLLRDPDAEGGGQAEIEKPEKGIKGSNSDDVSEDIEDRHRIGRPSRAKEIDAAYQKLFDSGEIDFNGPMTKLYPEIRKKIWGRAGGEIKGLGKEAIRKVITEQFRSDKEKSEQAQKPSP